MQMNRQFSEKTIKVNEYVANKVIINEFVKWLDENSIYIVKTDGFPNLDVLNNENWGELFLKHVVVEYN